MIRGVMNLIQNLIKHGRVSRSIEDTGQFPVTQVTYYGDKVADVHVISPYGLDVNLPTNALVWMFNIMGQEENKAAIGNTPQIRFKELKEGEVAVGNPLTRSVIKFLENGDIEVTGVKDQRVTINDNVMIAVGGNQTEAIGGQYEQDVGSDYNITVGGDLNITTSGNIVASCSTFDVTASSTGTITASTLTINGNTLVNGTLGVSGNATFLTGTTPLSMSSFRTIYNTHTHDENDSGGPTDPPNQPI